MKRCFRFARGFTLVELLVAIAVMGLVLVLLLQMSSQSLQVTRTARYKIESEKRARAVLDTLAADFANRVDGPTAPVLVKQSGGDLQLIFLTRSRGPIGAADFRFLAVAYELAGNQLVRKTAVVAWNQADLLAPMLQALSSPDSTVIADGILRFEASVVLSDGRRAPLNTAAAVAWLSDTWQSTSLPSGFQALRIPKFPLTELRALALVVGVAAIDDSNLEKLTARGLSGLALLPGATGEDSAADVWSDVLASGGSNNAPAEALSSLSFLQQTFPLR
jgi:prepilin-type N-terminal cleavage/methylation domain-containing protein